MNHNLLQIVSPLKETVTANGNVLSGTILVSDVEYIAQATLDKTGIWIIDPETSLQDSFSWEAGSQTYLPDSLNGVTDEWHEKAIDAIDSIAK